MKETYLPAQFNERIEGFAPEIVSLGLAVLFIIFTIWSWWINVLVIGLTWYVFTAGFSVFFPGQSLGKKSAKTRVVNDNYEPVSLLTMHLREVVKWLFILASLGLYIPLSLWVFSKNRSRQTWHDLILKTHVIYQDSQLY